MDKLQNHTSNTADVHYNIDLNRKKEQLKAFIISQNGLTRNLLLFEAMFDVGAYSDPGFLG
jgi:hypothetical protein